MSELDYQKKIANLNFLLDEVENEKKRNPNAIRIMKLVSDTDEMPRLVWDGNTVILHANKAFLDALGYSYADVVGKKFFNDDGTSDFISPDTIEGSIDVLIDNVTNGVEWSKGIINKWFTKNGETRRIEWMVGFNDDYNNIGSAQCYILSAHELKEKK